MIDTIAFDADDTLWHNEPLYDQARIQFCQILSTYQPAEKLESRLSEIEIANIQIYGYGIKSFILSMVEAAVDLSAGRVKGDEIQGILDISRQMLTADVPLFDHVKDVLEALHSDYDLILITKGDLFEQSRKVERSGLANYFRLIEVVEDKTEKSYRTLLQKYNIAPARFLMVGNSIRSDILPVVKIGGQAVYIPYATTWVHETVADLDIDQHHFAEINNLIQLPEYLKGLA
ncbi:MAG: HAD hydrolase-like protein [Anaerolineaceae bacterium]|nr:HAD hydrolase-like protein [Anaerolineaceae bacterium]